MVYWITGRSGAGKTSLAKEIALRENAVILDGDEIRKLFGPGGFTPRDRFEHLIRMSKFAILLERQGFTVVIACISPDRAERKFFQSGFRACKEVYIPGGTMWPGTKYEEPLDE